MSDASSAGRSAGRRPQSVSREELIAAIRAVSALPRSPHDEPPWWTPLIPHMGPSRAARDAEAESRAAQRLAHLRHTPCDCDLCERAAIAEVDGKLARADAERLAAYEPRHDWAGFAAWHRAYMLELGPMVSLRTDPATDPRSTDRWDR